MDIGGIDIHSGTHSQEQCERRPSILRNTIAVVAIVALSILVGIVTPYGIGGLFIGGILFGIYFSVRRDSFLYSTVTPNPYSIPVPVITNPYPSRGSVLQTQTYVTAVPVVSSFSNSCGRPHVGRGGDSIHRTRPQGRSAHVGTGRDTVIRANVNTSDHHFGGGGNFVPSRAAGSRIGGGGNLATRQPAGTRRR